MASSIESFLKLKPKQKPNTKTVRVTLQGIPFEFDVKGIDPELLSDIQVANTVSIPSSMPGGPATEGANPVRFALDICEKGIVEPDLNDADLQDHYGALGRRETLREMFKNDIESLRTLFEAILELSNSNPEATQRGPSDEDVARAKN